MAGDARRTDDGRGNQQGPDDEGSSVVEAAERFGTNFSTDYSIGEAGSQTACGNCGGEIQIGEAIAFLEEDEMIICGKCGFDE